MNQDDPFAEPSDTDKTVINLNPGGRRLDVPPPPSPVTPPVPQGAPQGQGAAAPPPNPSPDGPVPDISRSQTGLNPLNAAATSLFSLAARIRNRARHADPNQLRESVIANIRAFESRAYSAGVPGQSIKVARYVLCATLDDVVLNTPWGGQSDWAQQSMVGLFHKETHGGERVYDLLERLLADPGQNRDLLEFLYMCLSLGFEGRLRIEPRGSEKHLALRDSLARTIRAQRGASEAELSPHWQGLNVPHRPVSVWMPIWMVVGVTFGIVSLGFFILSFALSFDTERLRGQLLALDLTGPAELARPAPPPPPPPPPPPSQVDDVDRIRTFLAPEISQNLVEVERNANTLIIRVKGQTMFGSGSDTLSDTFQPVVDRVAAALEDEAGRIIVAGHSDNIPINTARFPSNLHLSLARAQSVMDRIAGRLSDTDRITAEGRAESEPIASNATAEGRAQNRRIDVILVKAG